MNEYYTYAYLREDGTPYYVGKGKNNRAFVKRRKVKCPDDKSKILFLKKNLTEKDAFKHEIYMINVLGRVDCGGILRNFTDGGEGVSGRIVSEEEREQMRVRELGNTRSLGKKMSEPTKEKLRKNRIGVRLTDEQKKILVGRKTKPLTDNPSPRTLYSRKWREKNRQHYQEYQKKYYNTNSY